MTKSIATGAALDADTWADFVTRLRHDCEGDGVKEHFTANAIFNVEARRIITGISTDYTENLCVYIDDIVWYSPTEYWNDQDQEAQDELNTLAVKAGSANFIEAGESDQWDILGDLENHTVTGWADRWETVNSHFTNDAAEAFIKRKKHDYPDGLRVYVDCQSYCWEWNAIKEAILRGKLAFTAPQAQTELPAPSQREQAQPSQHGEAQLKFAHLAGRGMHELRNDELVPYLLEVGENRGLHSEAFFEAASWVVSELARKTNDELVVAAQLSALREQAQPAENFYPHGVAHLLPPLTINSNQIAQMGMLVDGDSDEPTDICIQHKLPGKDTDGEHAPGGLYAWISEYPEEGSIFLDPDAAPQAQPAHTTDSENWDGHKFKEVRRGVWLCECGKQITESAT